MYIIFMIFWGAAASILSKPRNKPSRTTQGYPILGSQLQLVALKSKSLQIAHHPPNLWKRVRIRQGLDVLNHHLRGGRVALWVKL